MKSVTNWLKQWGSEIHRGWERFWFVPQLPHTLALIRILTGGLLFYSHLVWALDLDAFLGSHGWIPPELSRQMHEGSWTWSYLWYLESPPALWIAHLGALLIFVMLAVGLFTRVASVLAWIVVISYCNRLEGILFGLDQFSAMITFYLMIGPSGAAYSVDRWLRRSYRRVAAEGPVFSVSANVAIRLLQLHMCIIYLFGGIGKMRGDMWWDGSAFWYAVALGEYQSMDMTWLVAYPWLIALLAHLTVFWETFYCVLVWPRATRPITLLIAFCVHGGIAAFLGMITFGLAMIIGNLSFIPPELTDRVVGTLARRTGPEVGREANVPPGPTSGRRGRRRPRPAS